MLRELWRVLFLQCECDSGPERRPSCPDCPVHEGCIRAGGARLASNSGIILNTRGAVRGWRERHVHSTRRRTLLKNFRDKRHPAAHSVLAPLRRHSVTGSLARWRIRLSGLHGSPLHLARGGVGGVIF
jgi:hypothetical protein